MPALHDDTGSRSDGDRGPRAWSVAVTGRPKRRSAAGSRFFQLLSTRAPSLLSQISGPAAYGFAAGIALTALGASVHRLSLGVVSGVGVGLELAALPLLAMLTDPPPPYAVGLAQYRRPIRLPSARVRTLGAAGLIAAMVVVMLFLPAWSCVALMLLAGAALLACFTFAWQTAHGRSRHQNRIYQAVAQHQPRFVLYTGRGGEGAYQLEAWVPVLERLNMPYLIVLRDATAIHSTRAITTAPIVVCPMGGDLDAVMADSLRVAFYVNAVATNSAFVSYRQLFHVYLGHGDSDKELSVHPMHAMFDRVFVAGQAAIDRYEKSGVMIPRERFVIVGRPQLAGVSAADSPVSATQHPRVLYAPTWRGYNAKTSLSSLPWGTVIVGALIQWGATVTFSPHTFSWQGSQEHRHVAAIDDLLQRDRDATGRPHRLAREGHPGGTVAEFDSSDALITDVGSVLVDYFATGKPYAVVLTRSQTPDTAATDLPSTAAAYYIPVSQLDPSTTNPLANILDDLLVHDPLSARRFEAAEYFLGRQHPGEQPFLDAARKLIDG